MTYCSQTALDSHYSAHLKHDDSTARKIKEHFEEDKDYEMQTSTDAYAHDDGLFILRSDIDAAFYLIRCLHTASTCFATSLMAFAVSFHDQPIRYQNDLLPTTNEQKLCTPVDT